MRNEIVYSKQANKQVRRRRMEVLASGHKLIRKGSFGQVSNRDRPAFPQEHWRVTTTSDGLYVFVLLHRHFLVEPQKRSQGWCDPVEVQADAWRSPPGIAFKPFFPAQALMATHRSWRSSRRGQVLRFLAEGNHLHRLSAPVPDPVPTDG